MSAEKWTKKEIWEWYMNVALPKTKAPRSKQGKIEDQRYICLVCTVNAERLIIGLFKGAAAERVGVYYITKNVSTQTTSDGVDWRSGKFYSLVCYYTGGYRYNYYNYTFDVVSGKTEGNKWIKEYLGDKIKGYCWYDIPEYLDDIESTAIRKRKWNGIRRKKDRINNWLSGLPPLPDDIGNFVSNTVFGGSHYAFGKKNSDEYSCSSCTGKFTAKNLKQYKKIECPLCGATLKCNKRDVGINLSSRITLIQSYNDIKGNIASVKREMYVSKDFEATGERIRIYEGNLVVLPLDGREADKNECYYYDSGEWNDKNSHGFNPSKSYCYPDVSALDGTRYDKRAIEAAAKRGWSLNYNSLMRCWLDEPRMEYLIKGGFYRLVDELTNGYNYSSSELMPGKDIKDVLGIDGQGVARLRENNGGVYYLRWLRSTFMCGFKVPEKTIRYFEKHKISPTSVAAPLTAGASPEQIANYIEKQRKYYDGRYGYVHITTTWRDTLGMTKDFGLNGNSYTIFPKDLKRRHAELCGIRDIKKHKDETENRMNNLPEYLFTIKETVRSIDMRYPGLADIYSKVKPLFEWNDSEYSVLVPGSAEDVLVEGYLLGHCIANPKTDGTYLYFERNLEGESYICFLRKNENVNSPWYTMEVEPDGSIRQLRTFGDDEGADRTEAKEFLKKWRGKVKTRLGKVEIAAAEVSREKRLAEFAELRKNQNKIYHGKLQGLLLVDVLEADFKEFNEEPVAVTA